MSEIPDVYVPEVKFKGWLAGVGSRHCPEHILELFIRLARTKTDQGWAWSSGDAYDVDRAVWYGAQQSEQYFTVGARIYLAQDGNNRRYVRDMPFFFDATTFTDTYMAARGMACAARGGWGGCDEWGMKQHTRNAMQIHGHTLVETVDELWYYGIPVGRPENEFVKGGTNTALQLAKMAGVKVRKNLYFPEVQAEVEAYLQAFESPEPYEPIDWKQIHDPRDKRITDFE